MLTRVVCDSLVHVGDHVLHDGLAGVAGIVESLIGRAELTVDPWNVAELLDLVEIEVCTPELGECGILLHSSLVVALVGVGEESVHLAEVTP